MKKFYWLVFLLTAMVHLHAQQPQKRRCSTMEVLQRKLQDPQFKAAFEANRAALAARATTNKAAKTTTLNDTVPVVVHIILANPNTVTDATCQSQLDVLNEDFKGKNADTTRIPAAFKSKFGRGGLTFMLAKTDPNGMPTTGIERRTNNITFTDQTYTNGKQYSTGGMDGWDPTKYFNMWVVQFTDGTLGISVFPGDPDPPTQHGYMCDYRCWGRGASYLYAEFNKGRTATHEIGHFWNLYHIWGDDNTGSCTGTDFYSPYTAWHDTPNQADATSGNPDLPGTGTVATDACATTSPGYMYQNYMDYTDDIALVMFTKGQWQMMDYTMANAPDRTPLFNSTTYNPPPNFTYDAGIAAITEPANNSTYCSNATIAAPKVQLMNYGTTTLTSVKIYAKVNTANAVLVSNWTGSLAQYGKTIVTLPSITLTNGANMITYYTELPNGVADQNTGNDAMTNYASYSLVTPSTLPVTNGFEAGVPGTDWTLQNPDNSVTWTLSSAYRSGTQSAKIAFYNYEADGPEDWLISPMVKFPTETYDSAFVSFYHAYRTYSSSDVGDSLTVMVSSDCGTTWSPVWTRGGVNMRTVTGNTTSAFTPTSTQWSTINKIDIRSYRGNNLYIAFKSRTGYSNNLYLDDISIYGILNALPVKLLYFKGNAEGGVNKLTWATSTEINAGYYSIERSSDGREFTAIGRVDAAGNTNANTYYSFNDNSFSKGINYYRLKVVDKDGSYNYSSIIALKDGAPANIVSVYPNPAKDVLFVQVQAYEAQKATLVTTDMQGRIVNTQAVQLANGNNALSVTTSNLPKGIYLVTVNAKDKTVVKFVKE